MGTFDKLQDYILPQEIDFFERLQQQSDITKQMIDELHRLYIARTVKDSAALTELIHRAQEKRGSNLRELYQVFITPVDKEAISRACINLDWVVMSVMHLEVELEIYDITDLTEYHTLLDLLQQEMDAIHAGFGMLRKSDFDEFSQRVFYIVQCDNEVIQAYARQVSALLESHDLKKIITRKEILNQLKEISKRLRMCANDLEDMLFKMS